MVTSMEEIVTSSSTPIDWEAASNTSYTPGEENEGLYKHRHSVVHVYSSKSKW